MSATIQPMLVTPDVVRLQSFYAQLLGAEQTTRVPDEGPVFFVALRVGDSELGLVADEKAPLDTPQRSLLSVLVPDVDALLDHVEGLGGTVLGPPNDMPWGQRVAHVRDPDGNKVNLVQPI
ncbi:VOC family protein [Streptomyces longispororuber]|uniref:VOC family protein n=1 Tax=Streptomyces TaxID=1883 RepID=UPI0024A9C3BC|nr:VOC family protein [Streptomyces sp. CC224B]